MSARMVRAAALGTVVWAILAFGSLAQTVPQIPPPEPFQSVDPNGVDLTTGQVGLNDMQTSVGDPNDGGLSRSFLANSLRDNLSGTLSANAQVITANSGRQTSFFSNVGLPSANLLGEPATFVGLPTPYQRLYMADGTVVDYDVVKIDGPFKSDRGVINTVTKPNGETLTYTYGKWDPGCNATCYRLQAVTSNLGYMVKYEYFGSTLATGSLTLSRVVAVNLAQDYCSDTAPSCSLTRTWSTATFGGSVVNGAPVTTVTDSLGRVTSYTGRVVGDVITQVQRPSGLITAYAYSDTNDTNVSAINSKITSVTTPSGVWTYTWTPLPDGNLQVVVRDPLDASDPGSHLKTILVDRSNPLWKKITSVTDERGAVTTYRLDHPTGRLNRITRPEGDYTDYGYDARGNLTSVTRVAKPGSGLANYTVTATYDATCSNPKTCNQPNSITENGATTDITYDPTHGGVMTVTGPAAANGVRPQTRYSYTALYAWYLNSSGAYVQAPSPVYKLTGTSSCKTLASCIGGADEVRTTITRGTPGTANNLQVTAVTVAAGDGSVSATTSFTYNIFGDVRTIDGPLPGAVDVVRNRLDTQRQLTGRVQVDPDGEGVGRPAKALRYTYNLDGKPSLVERGTVASQSDVDWLGFILNDKTVIKYDGAGRKSEEDIVGGSTTYAVTQYDYDAANNPSCTAVRMNPAAFASLPISACDLGAPGANGPDRITRTSYYPDGRMRSVTEGYQTSVQRLRAGYAYTPNGKLWMETDGNNNLTTYEYDGFDRLTKTSYPSPTTAFTSSTTDYVTNSYDPTTWRVIQERRRDGQVVGYTYDPRGNRITRNAPVATSYGYDNFNRQISAATAAQTLTTAFDALGRITATSGPLGTVAYQYDAANRRTRMTWPDAFFVTYDYDNAGAVTAIRESGSTALVTFGYDNLGRRTGLARGNGVVSTYGYDSISRLQSLSFDLNGTAYDQALTFAYNPASQILIRTSSNPAYAWNQLFNVSRAYGVNGLNQLTSSGAQALTYDLRGNMTSDGSVSYAYDVDNHLVSASTGAALAYDPVDRLYQTTSSGGTVTRFLYDGVQVAAEYTGANVLLRRFVNGLGADEPLVIYEDAPLTPKWLVADQQGSIVAKTQAGGLLSGPINTYDEYGIPASNNLGRFQYTGQMWIPELGLYHYKARAYSPYLGRFLQTDPIGQQDDPNLYAYVKDDPVNHADPTGMIIDTIADIAFIALDTADIAKNGLSLENGLALGADVVGAAVPFATGGGLAVRGAFKGAEAIHRAEQGGTSSRAAARQAMRDADVPTSRPRSDVKGADGRPTPAGSRQQTTTDSSGRTVVVSKHGPHEGGTQPHDGSNHVHVAPAKTDGAGNPITRPDGSMPYRNGGTVKPYDRD